jgi:hypothetical protein
MATNWRVLPGRRLARSLPMVFLAVAFPGCGSSHDLGPVKGKGGSVPVTSSSGSGGVEATEAGIQPDSAAEISAVTPAGGTQETKTDAGAAGVAGASNEGGVGGTVAAGGEGGTSGKAGYTVKRIIPDRCTGDAGKTVILGDSFLALSGEIITFLQTYSGLTFTRTFYESGAGMILGLTTPIPDQYRAAKGGGPIQSIIMDGGGNDVIIGDLTCSLTGLQPETVCEGTVRSALAAANDLLTEAASEGVQEVIYFFYPYIASDVLNGVLDGANPRFKEICENHQLIDCTFVDTREGYDPAWLTIDGIHPTTEGSEFIATKIWAVMQNNCTDGVIDY